MPATSVPEVGQLAEVRGRRFVATDVSGSPAEKGRPRHHLVSLTCVDDDALGEEVQVIWEREIGARAFAGDALPAPTRFDPPDRLAAFLDAVRWGVVSSSDLRSFHAPFRSGVEIEDYQLEPLVRAVRMPRVNLLIADAVGLGKTIEAGLILQELIFRNRVRTVLVVCPAGLQIQWREEMRDRFGLEFVIVDGALVKRLRRDRGVHANPWEHYPRLITSYSFLRQDRVLRRFRELLPPDGRPAYPRTFDLLICDEAHLLAPSGPSARESQQTAAVRELAQHFEHRLFLTATPHNGFQESFTALLEMLDNQRYARGVPPDPKHLHGVTMVRRLRAELELRADGSARFPRRVIEPLEVDFTPREREVHWLLREYSQSRRQGAAGQGALFATEFILKLIKKRLFSSPAACRRTLLKHLQSFERPDLQAGARRRVEAGVLRRLAERLEETPDSDEDRDLEEDEAMETASRETPPLTLREREILRELLEWCEQATFAGDSRSRLLIEWLSGIVRPDGRWSDERVILFTEYRDTQNWLRSLLTSAGLATKERLLLLYGGMQPDEREAVKAAFQASPGESPVRILLATDAASEGINLQNYCSRLAHVEIPWNPNRLEQRNGRIDRHGQRHPPRIYHFVPKGYRQQSPALRREALDADLEFLRVAAEKVNAIREDLGSVGPVLARQVEEAMLGKRLGLDTREGDERAERARRLLKTERDVRREVARLQAEVEEVRDRLRLSPENIVHVTQVGLALADQPGLRPAERPGEWIMPPLRGAWEACREGLADPYSGRPRPITFDQALAAGREDVVLIHLNHRLVQMCLRLLRAQLWATGGARRLSRCACVRVSRELCPQQATVAIGRLLILGATHEKLHEEIVEAGVWWSERGTRRMTAGEVSRALSGFAGARDAAGRPATMPAWESLEPALRAALDECARGREEAALRNLSNLALRQQEDVAAVLEELRRTLEGALAGPDAAPVLPLQFAPDPSAPDRSALSARIEAIPEEIVREQALIARRHENPTARLFPAAVLFLFPDGAA